ncbi:unnamed protein product, partial [Musa acuminata subsp. burmannicoides]
VLIASHPLQLVSIPFVNFVNPSSAPVRSPPPFPGCAPLLYLRLHLHLHLGHNQHTSPMLMKVSKKVSVACCLY